MEESQFTKAVCEKTKAEEDSVKCTYHVYCNTSSLEMFPV